MYVYAPYGVTKSWSPVAFYVKLALIFKAIHKQSFLFLLYATPSFLALAHFLPTVLHTFIRAHSPSRRSFHPGVPGLQNLLDYTEATRDGNCRVSTLPSHTLVRSHAPDNAIALNVQDQLLVDDIKLFKPTTKSIWLYIVLFLQLFDYVSHFYGRTILPISCRRIPNQLSLWPLNIVTCNELVIYMIMESR